MEAALLNLRRLIRHRNRAGGPRGPHEGQSPRNFLDERWGPALGDAPPRPWVPPLDPVLAAVLARWAGELRERWEERAAIKEFDAGLLRGEAERSAFEEMNRGN